MNKKFLNLFRFSAFAFITIVVLGLCGSAEAKDKVFIVGVDNFANLSKLNACADVDALVELLKAGDRFEVVAYKNVTAQECLDAFTKFNYGLKPDETALYVFVTHGFMKTGGTSRLCFKDAKIDQFGQPSESWSIEADRLVQAAQGTNARSCAFIFDVCRVGERSHTFKLSSPSRLSKATCVMYSCPQGSPSSEDDNMGRGRFMLRFCEALRGTADFGVGNCDGVVSYMEAFQYCEKEAEKSKEGKPTLEGSLSDAFSLALTNSTLDAEERDKLLKERNLSSLQDLLELQTDLERQRNELIAVKESKASNASVNPYSGSGSGTPRLDNINNALDRGQKIYSGVMGIVNRFR